jgi:hypothetical protein
METTQNRIWAKARVFKQTIAAKILGLAVFLLLLTIGLAGFLLSEVARTEQALKIVAHLDVPLTESISRIHEFGLRRRLAFERWFGALNATEPNPEIISEAKTNYDSFTVKLTNEFATARGMIASYPGEMASRPLLVEVRTLLDQIEPAYPVISSRQREVLDLQRSGHHEKASALLISEREKKGSVLLQHEVDSTPHNDQCPRGYDNAFLPALKAKFFTWGSSLRKDCIHIACKLFSTSPLSVSVWTKPDKQFAGRDLPVGIA